MRTYKSVAMTAIGMAIVGALLFVAMHLGASLAFADQSEAAEATSIDVLRARTSEEAGVMLIPARLTNAEGDPLSNEAVFFYESNVDFFGDRPVDLGMATTDATGTATLYYTPASEGDHEITARFYGDEMHESAEGTSTVEVSGPVMLYEPEPVQLEPLSDLAPIGAFVVAAVVWGALAVVVIRVVAGIRSARRAS